MKYYKLKIWKKINGNRKMAIIITNKLLKVYESIKLYMYSFHSASTAERALLTG